MISTKNPAETVLSRISAISKWKNSGQKLFESLRRPFTTYQEDVRSVDAMVSAITRPSWGVESPSSDAMGSGTTKFVSIYLF